MTYRTPSLRPGLTAIAAVLALSATPAFAQSADQAAPPVTIAPPAPTAAPAAAPAETPAAAPLTVAPAAADTTANMSAPAEAAAPSAAMATQSPVVVHQAPTAAADQPAARTARVAAVKSAPGATPKAAAPAAPAPAPIAAVTPAAASAAPATPAPPPAAATPDPQPAAAPTKVARSADGHEAELIGAGVVGLLVIGGGAFALSRRRRDDRDADIVYEEAALPEHVEPAAPVAQASYAAPVAAPLTEPALLEGAVPDGFDLSRFGPHTRAAYLGPTADNPFQSLRKRLKRANFYDQRLREAGGIDESAAPTPIEQEDRSQSIVGKRLSDRLNFRPARSGRVSFKPATA